MHAEVVTKIILNELDEDILKTVSTKDADGVSLQELNRRAQRFDKHSYQRTRYHVKFLKDLGLIRTAVREGQVICFPSSPSGPSRS